MRAQTENKLFDSISSTFNFLAKELEEEALEFFALARMATSLEEARRLRAEGHSLREEARGKQKIATFGNRTSPWAA